MVKVEVSFNDDRSAILHLEVTLADGRKISLTPLDPEYDEFFAEAGKVIDIGKRVDELVKTTDWRAWRHFEDSRGHA
jgi:hypothetical protein